MIVVWRVTDSCNLSCPFCAFDKRLSTARRAVSPETVERMIRVLADYREATGEAVLLSWLGGEPLTWKPLVALTDLAVQAGLEVSATTNGTALGSPAMRQHIARCYKELTVSVDGLGAFHDRMRGWPGAFEKLRQWVPALATEARAMGSELKLKVNTVLMHQNLDEFEALCDELAGWGIAEITFNQLGGRDRPEFYPAHRLMPADVDRIAAVLPAVRRQLAQRGVTIVGGERYLERFRMSAAGIANRVEDCGPGESFLFIDEQGRMAPCGFTNGDYAVRLDEVTTAVDIAALPFRFRTLRDRRRSPHCDDCLSTQFCDKFAMPEAA